MVKKRLVCRGKSYTGEGSASSEKLEKPVWRPKGRQLNKFKMKTNCFISLSCLPSGLQSCFQAIWSFPLYHISLVCRWSRFWMASESGSLAIWNQDKSPPFCQKTHLKSGFWMSGTIAKDKAIARPFENQTIWYPIFKKSGFKMFLDFEWLNPVSSGVLYFIGKGIRKSDKLSCF